MDKREFSRPYAEHQRTPESTSPELQEIVETAEAWSSFFDGRTLQYMQGETYDIYPLLGQVKEYVRWTDTGLVHTRKELINRLPEKEVSENSPAGEQLSHLTFHEVNAVMSRLWLLAVSFRNVEIPDATLKDAQTLLAMKAVKTFLEKRRLENNANASELSGIYAGQLTEFDTQIILLEMMRRPGNDALISFPAPPVFESSRKLNNADFLLVDREHQQARGIQAKTYANPINPDNFAYSRSRITLIDGRSDLGNTTGGYVRIPKTNQTGTRMVHKHTSKPGLISMDHLQRTGIKDIPYGQSNSFGRELLFAKGRARELSGNRKSYIQQATDNVEKRLLHDLYMDREEQLPDAS